MRYFFLALALSCFSTTSNAADYIVKFKSPEGIRETGFLKDHPPKLVHSPGSFAVVELKGDNPERELKRIEADPEVEYVVANAKIFPPREVPVSWESGPQVQWANKKIGVEKAWQAAGNQGSRKITVAVIDTGVDYRHRALAHGIVKGYDFVRNTDDPMDLPGYGIDGHGTHCAGIIAASGKVDDGTVGVSPVVSIMPLRIIDLRKESGELSDAIRAIDYAIEHKVNIISASWGSITEKGEERPLLEAMERARKAKILFVSAAGNGGADNDRQSIYPANARLENTITVAASDFDDRIPQWSNFGFRNVDLAAPGSHIISTMPRNQFAVMSGTSMATPFVSGLAALALAQDPDLSPVQLKALLQASANKIRMNTACSCRIDAEAMIKAVRARQLVVAPNAGTFKIGKTVQFYGVYGRKPLTFSSLRPDVGQVSASGLFTPKSPGLTEIHVTDANGQVAKSLTIQVE